MGGIEFIDAIPKSPKRKILRRPFWDTVQDFPARRLCESGIFRKSLVESCLVRSIASLRITRVLRLNFRNHNGNSVGERSEDSIFNKVRVVLMLPLI